jgi:hypothetical protein
LDLLSGRAGQDVSDLGKVWRCRGAQDEGRNKTMQEARWRLRQVVIVTEGKMQ